MIMIIKFLMIIMIIIMDITFITNWPESNAETHCHSVVLILSVHMVININFCTTHFESNAIFYFCRPHLM